MNDYSKVPSYKYIVNGNNHVVNTKERLEEYIKKGYNAECGSGFYCIEDLDIAKKYAHYAVQRYGGKPIVNIYRLNHERIQNDLKVAYFNSIEDPKTLEYIGGNLSGEFPSFCKVDLEDRVGKRPVNTCYSCQHNCLWSGDYIEAVLSDATYNLDDIFVDYWNKKLSFHEAVERIYTRIDEADDTLRIQIVLRGKILDINNFNYLEYVDSMVVDDD